MVYFRIYDLCCSLTLGPLWEKRVNVFTWKHVLGIEKGWLGLEAKKFFVGKGNASCCIPPPQLSFISNSAYDGVGSKPEQAATSNCQRESKAGEWPRNAKALSLWWLKFQLLLHLALSPVMKEDFFFLLLLLKLTSYTSGGHIPQMLHCAAWSLLDVGKLLYTYCYSGSRCVCWGGCE